MVTIELKLTDADRALFNIQSEQDALFKKAASRALNKTARWLKKILAQQTARELQLKVSLVRSGLILIGAKQSQLRSTVSLNVKSGVVKANALGKMTQHDHGVQVGHFNFERAFIATMPSGHESAFKREDKTRLPIREKTIVFTGELGRQMEKANDGMAQAKLTQLFEREYRSLLRMNGGSSH